MDDARARPSLRRRLEEKLPEILIEAASIVIALLLAFALNDWHERSETRQRAETARAAILAELARNRAEIEEARPKLRAIVDHLNAALAKDAPPSHELNVDLDLSLLSSAAWHASLATQATSTLDFDWLRRAGELYEIQDSFLGVQAKTLEQLGAIPADPSLGGQHVAASLVPRISTLSQLADALARRYGEFLDAPASGAPAAR
jgi:hypothetical protein